MLAAWDSVPEELLRKGMEKLILTPATAPLPSTLVDPAPLFGPALPPDFTPIEMNSAIDTLNTLDAHDVPRVNLPDETDDKDDNTLEASDAPGGNDGSINPQPDSVDSQAEPVTEPMSSSGGPPLPHECPACDGPLRRCAAVQCPICHVWLHASCYDMCYMPEGSALGRCLFCPP